MTVIQQFFRADLQLNFTASDKNTNSLLLESVSIRKNTLQKHIAK